MSEPKDWTREELEEKVMKHAKKVVKCMEKEETLTKENQALKDEVSRLKEECRDKTKRATNSIMEALCLKSLLDVAREGLETIRDCSIDKENAENTAKTTLKDIESEEVKDGEG